MNFLYGHNRWFFFVIFFSQADVAHGLLLEAALPKQKLHRFSSFYANGSTIKLHWLNKEHKKNLLKKNDILKDVKHKLWECVACWIFINKSVRDMKRLLRNILFCIFFNNLIIKPLSQFIMRHSF